jgi:hypothetical protein
MIGYTTVGTNKFDEAAEFYDALLGRWAQVVRSTLIHLLRGQPDQRHRLFQLLNHSTAQQQP